MTPPDPRPHHWVIGDVHGCAESLQELLSHLPAADRLVFIGDVINRGPASEACMETVWGLVEAGRAVWLMGNHERDLVEVLRGGEPANGRRSRDTYRLLGDRRCRAWGERLENLPLTYGSDGWVATHAGFDPHTWEPDLNIRAPFWRAYDGRFGDVVVGHTPGPFVRRLNRILLIDTGACYGGPLTAYCPETGQTRQARGLGADADAAASGAPVSGHPFPSCIRRQGASTLGLAPSRPC